MTHPHDQRAIDTLRRDVETSRDIATRYVRAAVDLQLRLLAAQRMLASQAERIADQQRTIERQQEQLEAQRDVWQRCAERLMND